MNFIYRALFYSTLRQKSFWPVLLLVVIALLVLASGAHSRNPEVPAAFQRLHPCPATGLTRGACPGYQRDHIIPLCAFGPDHPENMQWLTVQQHTLKTKEDVANCTKIRRGILFCQPKIYIYEPGVFHYGCK